MMYQFALELYHSNDVSVCSEMEQVRLYQMYQSVSEMTQMRLY